MLKRYIITLGIALSIAIPCNANKDFSLTPCLMKTVSIKGSNDNIKQLELLGIPWSDYSRGLIRFNLKSINYNKFSKVKKATLSFSVIKNNNPSNLPCNIAMIKTFWNSKASWRNPTEKSKWPSRRRYSNIDYSCSSKNKISFVIFPKVKQVKFNVTNMVDAWLYQGIQNHGIMLRIGKTIFGKPNMGKWNIVLTKPILKVEMTGTPPSPSDLKSQTLRFYPSALLPPVRQPYIFHLFAGIPTQHRESVINSFSDKIARPELGKLPLGWCYGPNDPYKKDEKSFINSYKNLAKNKIGIEIDEWQGYTRIGKKVAANADPNKVKKNDKITWSIKGILAAKKMNPAFYTAIYWRGEDSIRPLTQKGYPDLLIIEGQSHLHKKFPPSFGIGLSGVKRRINYARKLGMIEQTIVLFGVFEKKENYRSNKILTLPQVDKIIKYMRKNGPEMPGIAFYGGKGRKLLQQAEALCYDYYIKPAPELKILYPKLNAQIYYPHLEIRAEAKAKDRRTIRRYDWFIDNRLVAKTKTSSYIWDVRGVDPGKHFITVHAIDSGWNRAAAQITVTVKALSTQATKQ